MRTAREFVNAYGWHIVTLIFLSGLLYADIQQKVDKTEFYLFKSRNDSIHVSILESVNVLEHSMIQGQATILYLICKDHPRDSACRTKEGNP